MSIVPGARIGPFSVTATLGAGGMGQVYRARDARLNRDVAIKVLPPEFATDPNRMARFSREAQVLAALSHPNIAAIFGLEESEGATALVMELVEGETLAEHIERGPIPLDEALVIARQIAEALEAAHEKGIIHRDLKPANVKIDPDGKVKVLDFGLAKAMDADPISGSGSHPNAQTMTLDSTRAGQIMGTAAYMSPEQARGKPVDKRADIWAFGVVLHEMLTGKSMFEGETVSDTLAAVLRADIDFKHLPPNTPPKIRRLLARCLERDAKKRLRDIGDAWIEMDAPDAPAPVVVAAPAAKRSWLPWVAAAVLGGAGLLVGFLRQPVPVSQKVTRSLIPQKGFVGFLSLTHDGSRLAYTEGVLNNLHLGMRLMDQFEGKAIPSTDGAFFPSFSPDGQWIVYSTNQNKIKKMSIAGGAPVTLCDGNTALGSDWGPDDTIVFSGAKGLYRVSASGGTPEQITNVNAKNGEASHGRPQFLPNGQVLFTVSMAGPGDVSKAAILDLKTKQYQTVAQAGISVRYAPTGHLLYLRAGSLFALPFDLKRATPTGTEAPVVEGVSTVGPAGTADYTFSDDGTLVYVTGNVGTPQGTTMIWVDRKGSAEAVTTERQLWGTGRLSPDGTRIANSISRPGGDKDVWVYDIARKVTTRLTFDGASDYPIWSRDGRRLIYGSWKDGKVGIYSVAADGSGSAEQLLAVTDGRPIPTSMTPDGKTVVYTLVSTNARSKIVVFTQGAQPRVFHDVPFVENDGQLSPDGKWIAYSSNESGSPEIYVQPFPGPGAKTRITQQSGSWPRWSANMKELFVWEGANPVNGLLSVPIQTGGAFQAGTPEKLFSMTSGTSWDPAPDGKHFMVEQSTINTATGGTTIAMVTNWFDELKRRAPAKR